jgi:hypothetical protein
LQRRLPSRPMSWSPMMVSLLRNEDERGEA